GSFQSLGRSSSRTLADHLSRLLQGSVATAVISIIDPTSIINPMVIINSSFVGRPDILNLPTLRTYKNPEKARS
ncbi:15564_t:CDS:1, partial [Dentiscutata erythropus]